MQVINVALASELCELAVQVFLIGDDFIIRSLVVFKVVIEVVRVRDVLNVERSFFKLFVSHRVQRERRDRCVRVLFSLSEEGDQVRDVLFKLGQILGYVVLVELGSLVISHLGCNVEHELRVFKLAAHGFNEVFDLSHLSLDATDLLLLAFIISFKLLDLSLDLLSCNLLVSLAH